MSLFPRHPETERPGVVQKVGKSTLGAYQQTFGLLETLLGALSSQFEPGLAARSVASRLAIRQMFFTGFEALPLVSVIAIFVGATIVIQMQTVTQLPGDMIGRVIVAVVLRELAPLTTAIIVAGRSGTAIATELGNMKANSEILALSSLGIDHMRFVVWPRMVGAIVGVMVLTVYFGIIAIMSGYMTGVVMGASSFAALQGGFAEALVRGDIILFFLKCGGLGLLVGWFSCHYGLEVRVSPTEVPQKASKAVIMTLLGCVVYNALVTAGFYMIVGPPVR
ncbi:MAG TPA: ABC transporter permease [Polyangiaceae bacterium]|jgi:phospholipid/cholesterol/gamma-HCH transport system permease protein|nr:ABC transporter permease [Polyangiaceae bacterium]